VCLTNRRVSCCTILTMASAVHVICQAFARQQCSVTLTLNQVRTAAYSPLDDTEIEGTHEAAIPELTFTWREHWKTYLSIHPCIYLFKGPIVLIFGVTPVLFQSKILIFTSLVYDNFHNVHNAMVNLNLYTAVLTSLYVVESENFPKFVQSHSSQFVFYLLFACLWATYLFCMEPDSLFCRVFKSVGTLLPLERFCEQFHRRLGMIIRDVF
jgi:hypothetical protein